MKRYYGIAVGAAIILAIVSVWLLLQPSSSSVPSQAVRPGPESDPKIRSSTSRDARSGDARDSYAQGDPETKNNVNPLTELGRKDLAAALAKVKASYTGLVRDQKLSFLLGELGKERLDVTSVLLPEIVDESQRAVALIAICKHWLEKDSKKLIEFVQAQKDGMQKNQFTGILVESLAEGSRVRDAAQMLASMPFSSNRTSGIATVAFQYAQSDPEAAIAWAASLPLRDEASKAQEHIWMALSSRHDLQGLQRFVSSANPNLRPTVLAEIGKIAGERGISELQSLYEPGSTEYEQAAAGAMGSIPSEDLTTLANQAMSFKSERLRNEAMAKYVERSFAQDQQQAVQWVSSCPPSVRSTVIRAVVSKWYNTDSMAASDWINSLPKGGDRDVALETLAYNLLGSDRETAKQVASAISDPAKRDSLLRSLR